MRPRVLMCDDEPRVLQSTGQYLAFAGFEFKGVRDCEFFKTLQLYHPDVVLLDWMMKERSGLEIVAQLRLQPEYEGLPVIMITGRASEQDQQIGLNQGADDYVTKPFQLETLVARIRAILRRLGTGRILYGDNRLRIFQGEPRIEVDGKNSRLTPTQWAVLSVLVRAKCEVNREELHRVASTTNRVAGRSVDMIISQLRALIEQDPSRPSYIQTVRGIGYRFTSTWRGAK